MSAKLPRKLAVWAMLALMGAPGLARARDPGPGGMPPPPPEGNPMEIEVPRGGAVLITLSAYSLTSPIIRYRIKRTAEAGQLGTPRMVTDTTAQVRYKPPAGTGPGEDSFSFEVQSAAGVSAAAEVHITITDKDPRLITPLDLEFGDLLPGQSARRDLVLQNIGGGLAQGTVQVPDGWTVEGDPTYRLGAGEKQSFTVIFKPTEEQVYTGDVEYTGDLTRATDLNGTEVAPVAVTSGTVELRAAGEMRVGTIHLENRTDGTRTLKVTAGPSLEADATVDVPGKGTAEIAVRAKGEAEVLDHVTIEGEDVKADVPVHGASEEAMEEIAAENAAANAPAATPAGSPEMAAGGPAETAGGGAGSPPAPTPTPDDGVQSTMGLPPLELNTENAAGPGEGMPVFALAIGRVWENEALVGCNFNGAGMARSYRLETQSVGLDAQGRPAAQWLPMANATLTMQGKFVIAKMEQLDPGTLYVVRLVGLDGQGDVVESSSPGGVWTVRAKGGWRWDWVGAGVVVAGGGWFGGCGGGGGGEGIRFEWGLWS
jgi:hypothetical protein